MITNSDRHIAIGAAGRAAELGLTAEAGVSTRAPSC
jgi:hypothetical protein